LRSTVTCSAARCRATPRASTLAITAQGHAILERIRQESTILLADSLRTLTPDGLAALAAALPALEQIADADTGDPRAR